MCLQNCTSLITVDTEHIHSSACEILHSAVAVLTIRYPPAVASVVIIFAYVRLIVHAKCGPKMLACPNGPLCSSELVHTYLCLCLSNKVLVSSLRHMNTISLSKQFYRQAMHDGVTNLRSLHSRRGKNI